MTAYKFSIAYDGTWYHDGAMIKRDALTKLFATRALQIDADGAYWLQTPHEKYPVHVEDAPFVIVDYNKTADGYNFISNLGEIAALSPQKPLVLRPCRKSGDTLPYIEIRNGLLARLGRSVYYNLVMENGSQIASRGGTFDLGSADD